MVVLDHLTAWELALPALVKDGGRALPARSLPVELKET